MVDWFLYFPALTFILNLHLLSLSTHCYEVMVNQPIFVFTQTQLGIGVDITPPKVQK